MDFNHVAGGIDFAVSLKKVITLQLSASFVMASVSILSRKNVLLLTSRQVAIMGLLCWLDQPSWTRADFSPSTCFFVSSLRESYTVSSSGPSNALQVGKG